MTLSVNMAQSQHGDIDMETEDSLLDLPKSSDVKGKSKSKSKTNSKKDANIAHVGKDDFLSLTNAITSGMNAMKDSMADIMSSSLKDIKDAMRQNPNSLEEDNQYIDNDDEYDQDQYDYDEDSESSQPPTKKSKANNSTDNEIVMSDFMKQLKSQIKPQEDQGPPIAAAAASLVNELIQTNLDGDDEKSKHDTYKTPNNTPLLCVAKVNEQIWSRVSYDLRTSDVRLQQAQKPIISAIVAATKSLEILDQIKSKLATNSDEYEDQFGKIGLMLYDSIQMSCQANYKLNMRRRELFKPEIAQGFKHLCDKSASVTKYLFGDDVTKQVKDIAEMNKAQVRGSVFSQSRGNNRGARGRGGRSRGRGRSQNHFLYQGQGRSNYQWGYSQQNNSQRGRGRGKSQKRGQSQDYENQQNK